MCGKTVEVYVEGCETIATDMKAKKRLYEEKKTQNMEYTIKISFQDTDFFMRRHCIHIYDLPTGFE